MKLAREAREISGRAVFVAGSIGPLGELDGTHGGEDAHEVFFEQARLLEGRGVDLFMVETFFDLEELETAVAAVRATSSLPIVAQLTFDEDAETLAGVAAGEAAERLRSAGVVAIGANCGLGPGAALAALGEMSAAADGLALSAQPNVGLPARRGGRIVYPNATPDYFAEFTAQATNLGARIVGGCCGTGPAQIAAIRSAVEEHREPRVGLRGPGSRPRRGGLDPPAGGGDDPASAQARGGRVVRLGRARPAEGHEHGVDARGRGAAEGVRRRRRGGHQRQSDGPRAAVRSHRIGDDRAHGRDRDDPARDASRCVRDGSPVAAPRRARRGDSQRPRRDRRPAARRRLPRLERRVRHRFDRPDGAAHPAEPGGGLLGQGDRRADLLLSSASP